MRTFCSCSKGDLGGVKVTLHFPGSQIIHVNTLQVFSDHLSLSGPWWHPLGHLMPTRPAPTSNLGTFIEQCYPRMPNPTPANPKQPHKNRNASFPYGG